MFVVCFFFIYWDRKIGMQKPNFSSLNFSPDILFMRFFRYIFPEKNF